MHHLTAAQKANAARTLASRPTHAGMVTLGAARLDRQVPDWATRINLDTFDMASETDDVLTQVFGDYDKGIDRLFGSMNLTADDIGHGYAPRTRLAAAGLTEAWAREITARR